MGINCESVFSVSICEFQKMRRELMSKDEIFDAYKCFFQKCTRVPGLRCLQIMHIKKNRKYALENDSVNA